MNQPRDWNRPEWSSALPGRDDLLEAVGLQRRRAPAALALDALAVFGAGMLVGAGLALLFAPREGRELREELAQRVRPDPSSAPDEGSAGEGARVDG